MRRLRDGRRVNVAKTSKRIGSIVPCENVDPHTGSFLDYGVIVGWEDEEGNRTSRARAAYAVVEAVGRRIEDWSDWAETHAWKLRDTWLT